jgi:dTDP-4-dehydrorhamnose reductase
VDVCEHEEDRSFEVNARAVKRLAELCAKQGTRLVHLSTNYVFAGDRDEPYSESDVPDPRSVYAISKLAGEHAALAYCPDALVVRGAGLYGRYGSASKGGNFVQRMLARAHQQGSLRMVADQRLSPTYTADLADALIAAVEGGVTGLLHLANSSSCSWHEFTLAIMEIAGVEVEVEAVETTRAPGGADRPLNGVLSCERAVETGIGALRPWREALAAYMLSTGLAAEAAVR